MQFIGISTILFLIAVFILTLLLEQRRTDCLKSASITTVHCQCCSLFTCPGSCVQSAAERGSRPLEVRTLSTGSIY